ncbi:hypothetical protein BH10ACT8_BH10ACT8_21860 [soil metagenome]|jgi:hypothetical protein
MSTDRQTGRSDGIIRLALGTVGVLVIGYGALRIFQQSRYTHPFKLGEWLIGSLLVHDVIIAPVVLGIGALLTRFVPSRPRAFIQGGLITAGLVSALGVILIKRQGKTASPALALLQQNYTRNLLILLGLIALVTAASYAASVLRSNRRNSLPPADQ